jgi:phage terminase large subunit GpA-like protein
MRIVIALAAVLTVLAFAGCKVSAESAVNSSNTELRVFKLADVEDGCKIYRFHDAGTARYYVTCPHADTTTNTTISSGKTTRPDSIPTVMHSFPN